MTLEFLTPGASAVARSPMERQAIRAGAQLERRGGWNVAVRFQGEQAESERGTEHRPHSAPLRWLLPTTLPPRFIGGL